jgi:putative transposase
MYPTGHQEEALGFMLDVTRQLYNAALQHRRDAYRMRQVSISFKQQYAELTALRKPLFRLDSRLAAVYRECEEAVLHRLDLAMQAFFRRCKRGETPGFPRYKRAARWKQLMFPHGDRALRFVGERVVVPGVGRVRLRKGRQVPTFGRAWIVRKNGRWYASFECERAAQPLPTTGKVVGIDRGVHVLAATSEGELIRNGRLAAKHRRVVTAHARALDKATVKDTQGRAINARDPRRVAAVQRLARAKEREANARLDALHKASRRIVNSADLIVAEKLNLRAMTRSAKGTVDQPGRNVGFAFEELHPNTEHGETWRVVKVTFPEGFARHSDEQIYYVGDDGTIRRHNYIAEAVTRDATGTHHYHDFKRYDGIAVSTRQRIYPLGPDGSRDPEPILVAQDIEGVDFS